MTGEQLRERREALQLNLEEISAVLRINLEYLRAIEQNDTDKLPVAVYAIGYIRTYADYLDIDPEPIIAYFSDHLSQPKAPSIVPFALIEKKRTGRTVGILFVLATMLVLIIFFSSGRELPFLTKPLLHEENERKESADQDMRPAVEITNDAERSREHNERGTMEEIPITDDPDILRQTMSSDQETVSDQQASLKEPSDHVLEIQAMDVTWILMHADSRNAREILFQPGQSKRVAFSGKTMLKIGNAGGIRLLLDGKDLGTLGQKGEVIRLSIPEE